MPIQLKPQLPRIDSPEALRRDLLDPSRSAVARLERLIADGESRIAKVRQQVAEAQKLIGDATGQPDSAMRGPTRSALSTRQPIKAIADIRKAVEDEGRSIVQALDAAAEMAVEMSQRHWSLRAMLRLAKPGGLPQATALRSQYAEILEKAGSAELAAWGQSAIDASDPVMMDAVIRENDTRKRDERAFLTPGVLELFGNNWNEYRLAQAILAEVVTMAQRGGVALAKFDGNTGNASLSRISLGLRVAQADYTVDEDGGIVLSQHPDHNSRLDAVGQAMRKMAAK